MFRFYSNRVTLKYPWMQPDFNLALYILPVARIQLSASLSHNHSYSTPSPCHVTKNRINLDV